MYGKYIMYPWKMCDLTFIHYTIVFYITSTSPTTEQININII